MESADKMELIEMTIQQLMEEEKTKKSSFVTDHEGDQHSLLTRLLTQLETLKGDGAIDISGDPKVGLPIPSSTTVSKVKRESDQTPPSGENDEIEREEIVKELKKVQKQNVITHCLLSAMIILTLTWQMSEVSLILKLKDGINHPFKSFGNMITGILKGSNFNGQDGERESSSSSSSSSSSTKKVNGDNNSVFSPLKMPELPNVDLAGLGLTSEEE